MEQNKEEKNEGRCLDCGVPVSDKRLEGRCVKCRIRHLIKTGRIKP